MSAYREILRRALLGLVLLPLGAAAQGGQGDAVRPRPQALRERATWTVVAPDAAVAWYDLMATMRLPGLGAFPLTAAPRAASAVDPALARSLQETRESEVLHFGPLYFPSGNRAELAAALRVAATDDVRPAPRATLFVGALRNAMPAQLRARTLPALADALVRVQLPAADGALHDRIRRRLASDYLPALQPWLALERLDVGQLIIAPGIGPEGRLFSATPDRADNQVAVGSFAADPDADAPIFAFVREICYPAVTRAAQAATLRGTPASQAQRTGFAAVRCGDALLEARLPAVADRYRAFWLRQAGAAATADASRTAFDRAFPADPALAPLVDRAISRLRTAP